jgi:hypothetical protein
MKELRLPSLFCSFVHRCGLHGDRPKALVVYNGKLYICGNEAALTKLIAGLDGNIEKADRQWRRISKL